MATKTKGTHIKATFREWIIAGTGYGNETQRTAHYIVTAKIYQDALKFFNKKYPDVKHYVFTAKGKLSKHKEGYIENK